MHVVVVPFVQMSYYYKQKYLKTCLFLKFCHRFDQLVTGPCVVQFCPDFISLSNKSDFALPSYNFVQIRKYNY